MRALRLASCVFAILLAGVATAAAATTWHDNRGGTYSTGNFLGGYTATAAGGITIDVGGTAFTCSGAGVTGGMISAGTASGTGGSTTPGGVTWNAAMTGTLTIPCRLTGTTYRLVCVFGFNATRYNAGTQTTYLNAAGKGTDGTIDVTAASGNGCQLKLGTIVCKQITGSFPATYTNPTALNLAIPDVAATTSTDGRMTIPAVAAGLTSADGAVDCRIPGLVNGNVTITAFTLPNTGGSPQPVFWETNP